MNDIVHQPSRAPAEIVKFRAQLDQRAAEIKMALPSGVSLEKFQRVVTTAAQQSPALLTADRQSLILACMKAAQDGLMPDGREAALVIFSTRVKQPNGSFASVQQVQYMPMVYGLRKKILQAVDVKGHPIVSAMAVGVVYRAENEAGYFAWVRGGDPEVQHQPMLELSEEQTQDSEIVAAYSIVTMADGTKSYEVMRRFEIDRIRQKSQTGALGQTIRFGQNAGKAIEPKGPWVTDFAEMAKKTVMRRHSKVLPMSGDVFLEASTEAADFNAASGISAVLDHTQGSQPIAIEGGGAGEDEGQGGGEQFDRETGESLGQGEPAQHGQNATDQAASEPEKPKRTRGPNKPKPEPEAAERQPQSAERETERAEASTQAAPAAQAEASPLAEDIADEQTGITKHPAEAHAEALLDRMAAATTIIDLDKHYNAAQAAGHLDAMPEEIFGPVLTAYERHGKRLGRRVREPEAAA